MIFVFGSNPEGRHGAGAARTARVEYGAVYGVGEGRTGAAYAIPTVDLREGRTVTLEQIRESVARFIEYAESRPDLTFQITRIGCGLAGWRDHQIAPLFEGAPSNCYFPPEWIFYHDQVW